jgi:hypothetical protein
MQKKLLIHQNQRFWFTAITMCSRPNPLNFGKAAHLIPLLLMVKFLQGEVATIKGQMYMHVKALEDLDPNKYINQ